MSRTDIREEQVWARMYCQYFRKPFDFDPEMIERALDMELGTWDRSMLVQTMRWMTSQGQSWPKSPTGRELAMAYKMHAKRGVGSPAHTPEGFINFIKTKMRAASCFKDRWNILCSPETYCGASRTTTNDECNVLHGWATAQWPDWHKPDFAEIESWSQFQEVPF